MRKPFLAFMNHLHLIIFLLLVGVWVYAAEQSQVFLFDGESDFAWETGMRAYITHFNNLKKKDFTNENDKWFFYSRHVFDAEKIDATDLDDRGCGEASGCNMLFMTGWAQLAGYTSEDELFKEFYKIDGTGKYGWLSVMKHVFKKLPKENIWNYYEDLSIKSTLLFTIEVLLRKKQAVCILYNHGTPDNHNGNHVLTVWGFLYNSQFPRSNPLHYSALIVSDSDDNKHGFLNATDAPNRLKILPITWKKKEQVFYCADGYIASAATLKQTPKNKKGTSKKRRVK